MTDKKPIPVPTQVKNNAPARWLPISLSLIAALIAIVSLSLPYFQQNNVTRSNAKLQDNWQQFQVNQLSTINNLKTQLQEQTNQINTLNESLSELTAKNNNSPVSRALYSTSYLIHTAYLSLQATHTTITAINALKAAKNIIDKLHSGDFIALQQALSEDMTRLKKQQASFQPNTVLGILDNINKQIKTLNFYHQGQVASSGAPTPATKTTTQRHWYTPAIKLLQAFKGLIIIRRQTAPIYSILTNSQITTVKENLSLKIALAQWALIQRNNPLFHSSLQTIQKTLTTTLPATSNANNIYASLKRLSTTNISINEKMELLSITAIDSLLAPQQPININAPDKNTLHQPEKRKSTS